MASGKGEKSGRKQSKKDENADLPHDLVLPPPTKLEDFIENLSDKRAQEIILSNISSSIYLMIDELLTKKLDPLVRTCAELKKENVILKQKVETLESAQTEARTLCTSLLNRLEEQETYSRRENVIIRGLAEQSFREAGCASADSTPEDRVPKDSMASVEQTVVMFCRDRLKIDLSPSDISSAHRLKKGAKDTTRPIIVRFVRVSMRDKIMRAKSLLKSGGGGIYVSEHLTPAASMLFYRARALVRSKKIAAAWTTNGHVFYKRTDSLDEKPTRLDPDRMPA